MLIIGFGVYKAINFIFRILFTLSGGKRPTSRSFNWGNSRQQSQQRRRAPNSDLNIDYVPGDKDKKNKKGYGGGEYVDYEEVK